MLTGFQQHSKLLKHTLCFLHFKKFKYHLIIRGFNGSFLKFITSAEREVKNSRAQECFKVAFGGPEVASRQMSQSCFGISSRYLRVLWFIFSGQVCYLSACLGFDVVTPERVADIARSLLVLSATINIWGGAQGICDAEECRKLAVCFRSEAGSCSRYFEISFKWVKFTQVACLHRKILGQKWE